MNLVGINLVEVNGRATPSIQGAATSVAALLVWSQRGPEGKAYRIMSFAQYLERFGGYTAGSNGAYAMKGFFDNGGGVAYVARVLKSDAAPSTLTITTGGGSPTNLFTLTAGTRGDVDKGAWSKGIKDAAGKKTGVWVKVDVPSGYAAGSFRITVLYNDKVVEVWEKLKLGGTAAESPASLNNELTGSSYLTVSNVAASGTPAATASTDDNFVGLAGGADGGAPGGTEYANAFPIFDAYDIQLLACPETDDLGIAESAITYCAGRGDCMFIGHVTDNTSPSQASSYATALRGDKVYGALYYPFINVLDPLGTTRWIPPTGHVMGVYARTDQERGVWKAPAGNEAQLRGALATRRAMSDAELTTLVRDGGVNGIRALPGLGIIADSSRTLSSNPLWLYVNVRLLFNFVKTSLKYGLRWVVQEPNDDKLWKKVKHNSVTPFLMGLWRRGAFGPGSPESVFSVKVDADNNPPASIQQGILNIEVYFYPSRPAETIVITVGQQDGGAQTGES